MRPSKSHKVTDTWPCRWTAQRAEHTTCNGTSARALGALPGSLACLGLMHASVLSRRSSSLVYDQTVNICCLSRCLCAALATRCVDDRD